MKLAIIFALLAVILLTSTITPVLAQTANLSTNVVINEVELNPQNSYVRKLQHQLAEKEHLYSFSSGREPNRKVKVFRKNNKAGQ